MDEPYHIGFVADETPDVRTLHERCIDAGLSTTHDDRTDVIGKYSVDRDQRRDGKPESVLADLEGADNGALYYWTDAGMMLRVGVTHPTTELEERWGRASVGFQTSEIDWGHHDREVYRARISDLLALVEALVPVVDPAYVWSAVCKEGIGHEPYMPDGRPIREHVEELSWITVMSESVIEQFGGREHVLATPAWRVTEFDTGHVMLVLEDHPYEPEEPVSGSWQEHFGFE